MLLNCNCCIGIAVVSDGWGMWGNIFIEIQGMQEGGLKLENMII